LDWLASLPNKETLKKINFFGNQLKEINFAWLLATFPNLEAINLENNPIKTKNLANLTAEQFSRLVSGIKSKKFRVVSWQGTILMDLLEYAQQLVARGNTSHNAHVAHLQELVQEKQPNEIRSETKSKTEQNNSQIQPKSPSTNNYLLIGGLGLLLGSVLAIGYYLGKNKKPAKNKLYFDEN